MIDFYAWATPNGRKVAVMLAETGLEHEVRSVDITKGEQEEPAFLKISLNNKIPAIVDHRSDGQTVTLFESGAILTYLADASGTLIETDERRWTTIQWLHWSIGGLGPMIGQLNYFINYAPEPNDGAIDRYRREGERLIGVLERRLAASHWIGGERYSIADIVSFPWLAEARERLTTVLGDAFEKAPALAEWHAKVADRPAVKQGMTLLADKVAEN